MIILLSVISIFCILGLGVVSLRRVVFTCAAVLGTDPSPEERSERPDILVIVPARNEAAVVGECLDRLRELDWPRDRLRILAVDDASTDHTLEILRAKEKEDARVRVLAREAHEGAGGKGAVLREAVRAEPFGEYIYVVDADGRVAPDALKILMSGLSKPGYAAAQGAMWPENPGAGAAAFYVAVESCVHQGITLTGARRLGATVSLLGSNYLVRREALESVGGFNSESRLEDLDLTMALLNAGLRVDFEPRAESTIMASPRTRDAASQHRAWSHGFFQVAAARLPGILRASDSLLKKADRMIFVLGYFDRPLMGVYAVCALAATLLGRAFAPWWILGIVLAIPAMQCLAALRLRRRPPGDYARLIIMPAGLVVDALTHFAAFFDFLSGKPKPWRRTSRRRSHD